RDWSSDVCSSDLVFSQVMRPAKALTDAFSSIHNGIAAGERVLGLIDERSAVTNRDIAIAVSEFKEGIRFKGVNFAYGDKRILSEINLDIPKGKTVALVGPSG